MLVGERVRTAVALPGLPAGSTGTVREVGRLFLVVAFQDGRVGYYTAQQLRPVRGSAESPAPVARECHLGIASQYVPYGSHLCLLASTEVEVLEMAARYLSAGLEVGDTCMCVGPADWLPEVEGCASKHATELARALGSRAIVLVDSQEFYLQGREFTAARQFEWMAEVLGEVLPQRGGPLRVIGYLRELLSGVDPAEWWEYERQATAVIKARQATAVCAYPPSATPTTAWRRAESVHPLVLKDGLLTTGGAPA